MNHFVPVFDVDDDHSIPSSSSGLHRQRSMHDDQILELLWQNGQVVVQSQSQNPRLPRKSSPPPPQPKFLPEDEPMSWLQYPLEDSPFDRELADLFSFPPPPPPPPSPPRHHRQIQIPIRSDSGMIASSRNNEMRESMVDSSDTPAIRQKLNFPVVTRNAAVEIADRGNRFRERLIGADRSGIRENSTSGVSRELDDTYDFTLTSSLGVSGASLSASATADLMTLPTADDRKRKGREDVDAANTEYESEDVEIESYEPKKQIRGGANAKRSRAAEVHNLSERRRRDRINEKMKALQELIPRSSKTDKASMLDEAIVYLKSLQMQVQMMSMGCGMVPMMFPGVQQYMGMGMAQQMMPFSSALPSSAMQTSGPTSHLNPRFPLQPFQMPSIPGTDSSRIQQASNQGEFNTARIPSLADPYQQCTSIHQTPMQIPRTDQILASQVQTEEAKTTKTL